MAVVWLQKVSKTAGQPQKKSTKKCVKITRKWVWGAGLSGSFETFWSPSTAKSVQNVTQFRLKRLSKMLFAARKCRQSAFLVTKRRFASLSPIILYTCRGWARGFPAWISASACLWSVAVSCEKTVDGEVHSFAVVYQTMYSNWRVR